MITSQTATRAEQLGKTLAKSALELEGILREVALAADQQMSEAARAFLAERDRLADKADPSIYSDYSRLHQELLTATVAATNVRDLTNRAITMRAKAEWWSKLTGRPHETTPIQGVVAKAVTAQVTLPATN